MSRRIVGTLLNPGGEPLVDTEIKIIALQSSAPSITLSNNSSFTTDGAGAYDEVIENGYYKVTLLRDGAEIVIGEISVLDGTDTTLPALLEIFQLPLPVLTVDYIHFISANGSKWKVEVDDSGNVITTLV